VESQVLVKTLALVPPAFVHGNHSSVLAGKTVVGKHIGWVGKNHVDPIVREAAHDLQTILMIECKIICSENRVDAPLNSISGDIANQILKNPG
jgi:hypothetical protein